MKIAKRIRAIAKKGLGNIKILTFDISKRNKKTGLPKGLSPVKLRSYARLHLKNSIIRGDKDQIKKAKKVINQLNKYRAKLQKPKNRRVQLYNQKKLNHLAGSIYTTFGLHVPDHDDVSGLRHMKIRPFTKGMLNRMKKAQIQAQARSDQYDYDPLMNRIDAGGGICGFDEDEDDYSLSNNDAFNEIVNKMGGFLFAFKNSWEALQEVANRFGIDLNVELNKYLGLERKKREKIK